MAMAVAVAFATSTASASAAPLVYSFDAQLSLTGKCSKSATDEIEDPGCPGGVHPPSGAFRNPGVATDAYGDIYVANIAETQGRIDVFSPQGVFITELSDPAGPQSIAVDSEGNLYTYERVAGGERQVRRFPPSVYEPLKGEIEYGKAPIKVVGNDTEPFPLGAGKLQPASAIAVNPLNGQLFVDYSQGVALFGPAKEENKLIEKEAITGLGKSTSITVDANHGKIYLSDRVAGDSIVRVFKLAAPYEEVTKFTGETTPAGKFLTPEGLIGLAVNDATGEFFVGDLEAANTVYQFAEDGTYLASIKHSFTVVPNGEIAIDDGPFSPHPGYLFVPSDPNSTGHVYAFKPTAEGPPVVEAAAVGEVTETEAVLHATVNPEGLATEYSLEYISQQQYKEEGESFANATVAGEGTLLGGAEGIDVSAPALALSPGTAYRFRVFAENNKGHDERTGTFVTAEEEGPSPPCANDSLRSGLNALLPDCRAYELVTPVATNGHPPTGVSFGGVYFPTLEASPDGNRASFIIEGGLIPGNEGTGAFNGDLYLSTRSAEGWITQVQSPSGKEAVSPNPGSTSPDQTYSFWQEHSGPVHLHYPDGHSELVGQGSLGSQENVLAHLITEGGSHVIFTATEPLESDAAPAGTKTIYDRAAEGPTRVVSLLPEDKPQVSGEDATYLGASKEGEGIAFSINSTIYLRLRNAQTFEVAGPSSTFAGVAANGTRVFYTEGGDLFAFDAEAGAEGEVIQFTESGDITLVNVASGGTRAYFVSPSVLTGEPNPNSEVAKAGKEGEQNLYLSKEGVISFVGRVTKRDIEGESRADGQVGGLGLWTEAVESARPGKDPSRTTSLGDVLLFESRANLAGFDSKGFAEIYRYDATEGRLDCLSCSPTGTPPTSDASLQSIAAIQGSLAPFSSYAEIPNQSSNGDRAFFQTAESLVLGDTDKLLDVYEWEEDEVGSCRKAGGCIYLISGGHSSSPDFLFAMSSSGDDVFFRTADILLPRDLESTLSIYDARVEGGFPEPEPETECEGEGCHPQNPPPALISPAKPAQGADDQVNEPQKKHCPKGKHRVKHHGREACVKNHHKKRHRHRGAGSREGGSR